MRTGGDGQEGLVHGVDVDVVDLVDAHDVAVARQQRDHAQGRPRQQAPVDQLQAAQGKASGFRVPEPASSATTPEAARGSSPSRWAAGGTVFVAVGFRVGVCRQCDHVSSSRGSRSVDELRATQ